MPLFSKPTQAFLNNLTSLAEERGVRLLLVPDKTIPYPGEDGSHVSGYFMDSPAPTLAAATGTDPEQWLEILVHEAAHMDQWWEGAACWKNHMMDDGREAADWLDAWCAGSTELGTEELREVVARCKGVEMDCERRTLAKIREWGLPIDLGAYAQRANAYVHFYDVVAQTRRWNDPGQAPYQIADIWQSAPSTLVNDATPDLVAAYRRHYGPGRARRYSP